MQLLFWDVGGDRLFGVGGRSLFGVWKGDRFGEVSAIAVWDVEGRSLFESVEDGDRFLGCGGAIAFGRCGNGRSFL